jgi:hypothetical protein
MPVATRTANAAHAIALKRLATIRGGVRREAAQPGNERGQRELTADPHGCGQHMQEELMVVQPTGSTPRNQFATYGPHDGDFRPEDDRRRRP